VTIKGVTVYTKPGCGPCVVTKAQLRKAGIMFDEILLDHTDEALMAAIAELDEPQTPMRSAPIVCVTTSDGDQYWAGHQEERIKALALHAAASGNGQDTTR
jgi:glutaredoxin-like protein NrdH